MPNLSLPPPSVQPLLAEGESLGVWRIRAALFRTDAGGHWYRARHALDPDRDAAVLVLPRNERTAGLMLRYGDLAADLDQIRHPAVAVPGDSGVTAGGQPYLILDWAGGRPLTQARARLSLRERLHLLVQLCEALRHVHQQGWLLAEVDPSLLWIGPGQQLSLMGLGLVRMPDPQDPFERGTSLGTLPGFLSPEQRAGAAPSLGSEAFGIGALLCLLVGGRLPDELEDRDVSLAGAWPALSAAERVSLDALIHKAICPLAAQRHASAEAIADDLRAWLAGENHSALALTPMPAIETAAPAVEAPAAQAFRRTPAKPPEAAPSFMDEKPRRRGLRVLLTTLALAVLAVGGWAAHEQVFAEHPAAAAQKR